MDTNTDNQEAKTMATSNTDKAARAAQAATKVAAERKAEATNYRAQLDALRSQTRKASAAYLASAPTTKA